MVVLLADEIRKLCVDEDETPVSEPLIAPFCPARLRPASYQLTLGDEIHIGGRQERIKYSKDNAVVLPPHQVAVVSTRETLRIPRNLVARWNLRVTNIYEGLLWTGGPQVDPGWEGQLFCPIYNLAERPVVLTFGQPLFTIDFVQTTPIGPALKELVEKHDTYPDVWFQPRRRTLEEHDSHRLRSAPYESLRELRELRQFRNFGYVAVSLIVLVLTFMVAALSVVAVQPTVEPDGPFLSFWPMTALVGAAGAFFFSLVSMVISFLIWRRFRKIL